MNQKLTDSTVVLSFVKQVRKPVLLFEKQVENSGSPGHEASPVNCEVRVSINIAQSLKSPGLLCNTERQMGRGQAHDADPWYP